MRGRVCAKNRSLLRPILKIASILAEKQEKVEVRVHREPETFVAFLSSERERSLTKGMAECLPREHELEVLSPCSPPPPVIPITKPSRPGSSKSRTQKEKDEEIEESLQRLKNQGKYVKLNVGGSLHYTTLGTLTKHDNMLRAMFSERIPLQTDDEGWVLIDRSGKYFGTILNFLRDGTVSLPETKKECLELEAEAKYYCIDDLVDAVEEQLLKLKDEHHPICRVPVITSLDEEHLIVSSSTKPVIKLLYNRGNNKYSYTSNSDDNLLKNIELFDKLAVRFSSRVKFVRDIVGRGEICCWAFYGHAKKIAEVCCESIVYATDRKHTKIEFPEAKILDETLNIMLYEQRSYDPPVALRRERVPRPPGTPEGVLSEDELR